MTDTYGRIPEHLRNYVVEQDYAAYDEIDQAVWRFILLQTHARLLETAHPAYVKGLRQTGISVERIPRIAEMDACLADFGWGAVAVHGFIPPRAFQEFQALGIMTIAADIRSSNHLAYTPAPDIVHESAGHAPIIPDATYAAYLRRFGEVGSRAFASPQDRCVYEAIRRLSMLKEDPGATHAQLAAANSDLEEAATSVTLLTEAALLARLHWWTVEYGLVGNPSRYRIYGAGLLSSLGESHFCHRPEVSKRRLAANCIEVGYDITKPQPQLFVAEDFDHLESVLSDVAAGFAQNCGGAVGLERALASEEVATLELSTGLQISGVLAHVRRGPERREYLQLRGPCALALGGATLAGHTTRAHPQGYGTPLGRLQDGTALSELRERDLGRFASSARVGRHSLRFASGVAVEGRLVRSLVNEHGRLLILAFEDCTVQCGPDLLFDPAWGVYDLAVGEEVVAAYAGPADAAYWPEFEPTQKSFPCREPRSGEDARILDLYREALHLWENPEAPELVSRFTRIAESLREEFSDKWLLRWNLLECLCKVRRGPNLASMLRAELLEIEKQRPTDLPISMGLRYLDERYQP